MLSIQITFKLIIFLKNVIPLQIALFYFNLHYKHYNRDTINYGTLHKDEEGAISKNAPSQVPFEMHANYLEAIQLRNRTKIIRVPFQMRQLLGVPFESAVNCNPANSTRGNPNSNSNCGNRFLNCVHTKMVKVKSSYFLT